MKTGTTGTFVISWSQTEVDGLIAPPVAALDTGSTWIWHGEAVRVDGPRELLRLDAAQGEADLRQRAARSVRRLIRAARDTSTPIDKVEVEDPVMEEGFVLTDGARTVAATLIDAGSDAPPLVMFVGDLPPQGRDLWVVYHMIGERIDQPDVPFSGGVICFTPGTRISTPDGPRAVETLREGDRVLTKDNGPQELLWIGGRRMTGARLYTMPHLRPVRISASAFGIERPEESFLVSPEHRMIVKGAVARSLFNTPEVLVAAKDLVNGTTIFPDRSVREVTYIHMLLDSHQVVWANGVETESFHPANASLASLSEGDRKRLLEGYPQLRHDLHAYGSYARRNLSAPEAAILRHEAA